MDSPVRKMQKKNDYNRHKLLRKIKRRRKAAAEQQSKAAEKELRRKLKMPKFEDGKDLNVIYPTLVDTDYDQYRAQQLGYGPAANGHYPSRDRVTGDILKYPTHPTFIKALSNDARLGYYPVKNHKKGLSRTATWKGNEDFLKSVNYYDNSYLGPYKFDDGKSLFGDTSRAYWGVGNNPVDVGKLRHYGYNDNMIWQKIKNSAYYNAGTLPEVYIRPNNDNAVHHAKEMFPDKNFRNSFLRYMDDSREDLNISQRDSVLRLYNIYSQSKFPTLHVLKGDDRSWYYPTNDMFIYDEDPGAYVSELAHAYLYNAKNKYKINILDNFRPKNWDFEELFGRRDRYNNPGTIEYNAHHIIEPAIWDYVEGYLKNINLNR